MKNLLLALMIGAVVSVSPQDVFTQQRQAARTTLLEVKQEPVAVVAPRECVAAFREFFGYLQKRGTDIVRDEAAQKRLLSQELRRALAQKVATFTSPTDHPDFPSNGTFVGAWDYPTTYAIVATRRYGQRAVIDVLYKWGPNTEYAGDERTTSFIFVLEDGAWKLGDIYTFRGAFVPAQSLSQYLREK